MSKRGRLSGYELAVAAGVAVVLLVSAILELDRSDGARDREDGAATPPAARPVSLSPAQIERIARRVERIRELRFKRPVRPLIVDRRRASSMVRRAAGAGYPRNKRLVDEEALKLLGLLRPDDDLRRALDTIADEQILGFYDDDTRRLVVVRDAESRPLLEITLAHELVHALEDQRFGFHSRDDLSDDRALAESALAEGTATEVMTEYAARYLEAGKLLDIALGAASGTDTPLPPYIEKSLLFPYEEGQRFVATFRTESGGWGPLDSILRLRHPRSAEQVLHPRKYALGERPDRVRLPGLRAALGGGWRRVGVSSVGEFDLRALFEVVADSPDPEAAAGWGGGRFELWRRGPLPDRSCKAPCVKRDVGALRLTWDTGADRPEAERALARTLEKGLKARRVSGRGGPAVWLSRGGAAAMLGSGRRTTLVLAPSQQLAARLLLATL